MNVDITPTDGFPHMYDYVNGAVGAGANPLVLIIFTIVIISYYFLFSYLGISGSSPATQAVGTKSAGITFIEIIMWALFIFLILINGIQYFFNIDIKAGIKNLFTPVPEVDITVMTEDIVPDNVVPEITVEPQVFHIPGNDYKYRNAGALCKAYGGRLATITEMQEAYNKGAEWCSYGWSDGQMALYPTQKDSWDKFQEIEGHEHDCGRPGINGGYIANPHVKFGANCYGYKPKMTDLEKKIMDNDTPYPLTPQERRFQRKVDYYRHHLPDYLVSPFNYDKWSKI